MYEYFLFDCDGVLWIGNQSIEGSFDALRKLIENQKKILWMTNASLRSRAEIINKARDIHGFN